MSHDVTEFVVNFAGFLRAAWPHLSAIEVERGDEDEWDFFSEESFKFFVRDPITRRTGVTLDLVYEARNRPRYELWCVSTPPRTRLSLGKPEGTGLTLWREESLSAAPFRFGFRSLSDVFRADPDIENLNTVCGAIVDEGALFPLGEVVCVPLHECRFFVEGGP